jgi:phage protein D
LPGSEGATPDVLAAACEEAETEAAARVARARLEEQQERLRGRTATPGLMLVDEPVSLLSAPRVILSKLIPRLNQRLTGSGSTIGDPRIRAGAVLRLEGIGEQFGGLYRVTSATHSLDSGGYRTQFEARKEIWFGSIPLLEQGAVPVKLQGQPLLSIG